MALKFLRIDPDVWRSIASFFTSFSIVGGKGITVTRSGWAFQVHAKSSDDGQRQYGGSGDVSDTFLVKVRQAGSQYDVWPKDETAFTDTSRRLANAVLPQPCMRLPNVTYTLAPNGTFGLAGTLPNGTTTLIMAFAETAQTEACS